MADAESKKKLRSRKSHRKSRLGCKNCKRRRLKCDENKPACSNCIAHAIDCDFSLPSPGTDSSSSTHPIRFKQSRFQSLVCSSSGSMERKEASSKCASVQCDLWTSDSRTGNISLADLGLYHHFITSTCRTIRYEPTDKHALYLIHVPRWGLTFPSILHLILALSALHLGHKNPHLLFEYQAQADDHFTFGVRSVTAVLSQLDSGNCQKIYVAAMLICLVYFGRGPRRGEYLVFSERGSSEWLVLMRGVRAILVSEHDRIFTGVLEPEDEGTPDEVISTLLPELTQHQKQIDMIRRLLNESIIDRNVLSAYMAAVDDLLNSLEEVFRMRSAGRDGLCLMAATFGWIYRLPEQFIQLLEGKDTYALIILAHWSILLKYMEASWLMTGWHSHVVSGVVSSLDPDFHSWIEWPVNFVHT
ncbi:transcriptional regulator family: Fungal Specific TF [Paecilomyces variotii]|nr:transcriptional regulator family: Fungal Specific TF [Paecilomyces variotii]KAJ9348249.1 transcriptional regulator family: Fungal Specific TF [Paecilomyces variotii]